MRLLDDLKPEEQRFVLDWLADHGANATDEIFVPAALTARLIIELARGVERIEAVMAEELTVSSERATVIRGERKVLAEALVRLQRERASWLASASSDLQARAVDATIAVDVRFAEALRGLSERLSEPLKPLVDSVATLPASMSLAFDRVFVKLSVLLVVAVCVTAVLVGLVVGVIDRRDPVHDSGVTRSVRQRTGTSAVPNRKNLGR